MANRFSKKYGNKGMSFQLSAKKICLSAPDATSLHHCLKNKQPKLICFQWYVSKYSVQLKRVWLMLACDIPCPHEAGKVLHLLNRKEMAYT